MVIRNPQLQQDLRQLRADGYNAVVLVVPWRGFQSSQTPVAYDPFYRSQMKLVLREAEAQGLEVILRVAYAHQITFRSKTGPIVTTQGLLTDPDVKAAWLDYHREVAALADEFTCCRRMFISWEELWHAYMHYRHRPEEERRRAAVDLGFDRFQSEVDSASHVEVPAPGGPGSIAYHQFVNKHMAQLFDEARAVNPRLGVEYRVDLDLVEEEGEASWLENARFYEWEPQRYGYWAPFMYAENSGEALSAEQALDSLDKTLSETSQEGAYPGQVVEQFNYIENTREYQGTHARIEEREIRRFLEGAAALLAEKTSGYGIWAPRDYRCSLLYNGAFLDSARGWDLKGSELLASGGVRMPRGGLLSQWLNHISWIPRKHPFQKLRLELTCQWRLFPSRKRVRARLNEGPWVELRSRDKRVLVADVEIDFAAIPKLGLKLELENCGVDLTVSRVYLYHLTYAMGLRDGDGKPGPQLSALRAFNRRSQVLESRSLS